MSCVPTRLLPALALSTLVLTACGGGDDAKKDSVVGKNAPEQCDYQFNDGSSARMSNAGQTYRIDSGMFGKQYNRYDLEAVLNASGAETVRYAEAINIYLRRIPYNGKRNVCLYEEQIPVAPDDVLTYWKSVTGGRLNNGEAGVDGLYKTHEIDGKTVQMILVRTSSERWTLVHELMHANFHTSRIALGQPEGYFEQINSSSDAAELALRDYQVDKTEANMTRLAQAVKALGDALRGTLINYALEEVANESVLVEEYAAGRLKNVPRTSVLNAAWYIKCSREKAFESLNSIANFTRAQVLNPSLINGWSYPQSLAQSSLDEISALDRRAQELATRAKIYSGATDSQLECDPKNAEVRARIENENPHLDYMLNKNPSIIAFKKAMRDLRYTRSQLAQ